VGDMLLTLLQSSYVAPALRDASLLLVRCADFDPHQLNEFREEDGWETVQCYWADLNSAFTGITTLY